MILVTGATGTVGRALVAQLVSSGAQVRATSRRPDSADLPVEVVYADLGSPDSIAAALDGVEQVFLLADGANIPSHDANLAHAAAAAGVAGVVKLSSGRVEDPSATDPVPTWHRAGEKAIRDSGVPWTFLRPMGFMTNTLTWANTIRDEKAVYAPFANGRVSVIAPEDIAAVAARVLTEPRHSGQSYLLTGPEALSPSEMVDILAEVLDLPLEFVEVPPAVARQAIMSHGVSEVMADAIMALRAASREEFTSTVTNTVTAITGRPATSFHSWATQNRSQF